MEGGSPGTGDILCRLSGDEEFSQLLYIAQKYLNRTFTPTDCDVLANLYGNLHMPTELLEYLIESCAQNGHTSIRYIEKVGLSWMRGALRRRRRPNPSPWAIRRIFLP